MPLCKRHGFCIGHGHMPTELLTFSSPTADRASPLKTIPSRQIATIRHDDFSFQDFLSLINPFHYVSAVSSLYQQAGGGAPVSPVSGLIGGALLGGPLGLAIAGIGAVFEEATGKGVFGAVADAVTSPAPQDFTARYRQIANAHRPDFDLFS